MCKNCFYTEIDGVKVHINGDPKDPEVMDALRSLVQIAKNYYIHEKT